MKLSLISPSRDNLKYLKWSYESVRKHWSNDIEYCVADDFSSDDTWKWCQETKKKDPNFKAIRNYGPTRLGHTILYDRLINEVATGDIVVIWHADMFAAPGADKAILNTIKEKTVISLTRIEPPLHPPGPEKILANFGTEPEEFKEEDFLVFAKAKTETLKGKVGEGIFAPWAIFKSDFQSIGGHDPLFAPQSREDSDIFNRFILNGYKTVQLYDSYCYHMTCRGSRYNPNLTTVGQESPEWLAQNQRSERNFVRKWGHMVRHDDNLKPIIPHKYDITFVVEHCDRRFLWAGEPWCSRIYADIPRPDLEEYIESEQPNTQFNLRDRVFDYWEANGNYKGDIIVKFDVKRINQTSANVITKLLPDIITNTNETGNFEYDIFSFEIRKIETLENNLIKLEKK